MAIIPCEPGLASSPLTLPLHIYIYILFNIIQPCPLQTAEGMAIKVERRSEGKVIHEQVIGIEFSFGGCLLRLLSNVSTLFYGTLHCTDIK